MQFITNLYTHAVNQANIVLSIRNTHNERGYRSMVRRTLSISGELLADSVADITTAIVDLEAGYPGLLTLAGLYDDDGTATAHVMEDDANCFGGIRVMSLDYPKGDATEYVNGRMFSIVLEADYIDTSSGELQKFEQTIRYKGTGEERFVIQETQTGRPVKQIVNKRTIQTVSQSGSAVGLTKYPYSFVPKPVRPNDEHKDQREVTEGPYEWKGTRKVNFQLSWAYQMEF